MDLDRPTLSNSFHLAGIIPVSGQELDFDFAWHPCLMPLDNGYSLIHRAIVECAVAGCETIWVVANNDIAPLIKTQIGDYIQDPVYYYRSQDPIPTDRRIEIPIFFTPIAARDRDKRDCLGWSVLHGAYTSYLVSKQLSKWITPDKFYVAFPYGIYDPMLIQPHRKKISSENNFIIRSPSGSIRDNKFLGFTFGPKDFIACKAYVRRESTGRYDPNGRWENGFPRTELPYAERWSARYFPLSQVFSELSNDNATYLYIEDYYESVNWKGYTEYMESDFKVRKPEYKWFTKSKYKKSLINFEDE